jgi:hypothetical protein
MLLAKFLNFSYANSKGIVNFQLALNHLDI